MGIGVLLVIGIVALTLGSSIFWELVTGAALFGIPVALARGEFSMAVVAAIILAFCWWGWGKVA